MPIYKQYDQEALNRQHNDRLQVPDFAIHLDRWEYLSRQTEKKYPSIKDIAYGNSSRELLDIYPSSQPRSKTLVFIHGGYWQRLDKADFQFIADAFRDHAVTTVLLSYPLAPAASMDQIVTSCREAIQWLHKNITAYNGYADEIYIAGHSAGGHLAAMLMTTNWNDPDLPTDMIKGTCVISGLFNLIPIQLSDINEGLNMDMPTADRNSPVQLLPTSQCPLIVAVGKDETNEFKDQSEELYNSWKEKIPVGFMELPGLNHYSIVETLLEKNSPLHKAMCGLMRI